MLCIPYDNGFPEICPIGKDPLWTNFLVYEKILSSGTLFEKLLYISNRFAKKKLKILTTNDDRSILFLLNLCCLSFKRKKDWYYLYLLVYRASNRIVFWLLWFVIDFGIQTKVPSQLPNYNGGPIAVWIMYWLFINHRIVQLNTAYFV